jgi:hypothetical protein
MSPSATNKYPRKGEPLVPKLLRPLVLERRPAAFRADADSDMLAYVDLGPAVWGRLPPETCERLALLVVDRVQTRLRSLPELARTAPLPDPGTAVTLPLERRTLNTLRRVVVTRGSVAAEPDAPWNIDRYLTIPRFGGRALVDLLSAIESRGLVAPPPPPGRAASATAATGAIASERSLDDVLLAVAHRLPISELQANEDLIREGRVSEPADLSELVRTAVKLGRDAPFRVIEVGGSRMLVRLSDVTMARAAYRIAVRAVQGWGTVTMRAVTAQLRAAVQTIVSLAFVEKLLVGVSTFRWLDRQEGWFWFVQRSNPLLGDVRKILSVVTQVPLARLWGALFRTRSGPPPSPEALQQICAAIPGTRVADAALKIDRALDRALHLSEGEKRVVNLLESAGGKLSESQIRTTVKSIGLPWTPIWRLLRSSPVVERSPAGLYCLVGYA